MQRLKDKTIVIVEDDPTLCKVLGDFLGQTNTTHTFFSMNACISALDNISKVDIFILDFQMKGGTGLDIYKAIRPKFPVAKVILMTGQIRPDAGEQGLKLGVDALVLKPFKFEVLERKLISLFEE